MSTRPSTAGITQYFGSNPANYAQFGLLGHEGIDYGDFTGNVIRAAAGGVVVVASDSYGAYGRCLILKHPDGSGTIYAHLLSFMVSYGQGVAEGQAVAYSDNTGNSSGPHLHFGYQPQCLANLNNGYWGCADPNVLLNQASMPTQAQYDELANYADLLNGFSVDGSFHRFIGRGATAGEMKDYKTFGPGETVTRLLNSGERKDRLSQLWQVLTGTPVTQDQINQWNAEAQSLSQLFTGILNTKESKDYFAKIGGDASADKLQQAKDLAGEITKL